MYVGDDGKLHFVNKDGADSALNFSSSGGKMSFTMTISGSGSSSSGTRGGYITGYINVGKTYNITVDLDNETVTINSQSGSYTGGASYTYNETGENWSPRPSTGGSVSFSNIKVE